jgi:hypothetical protein
VVVGDDEDAVADPRTAGGRAERLRARKGVPALTCSRQVGEFVDPEERRPGDMRFEIGLVPRLDPAEVVAAIDEAVDQ